ncbi:N-acetylglucosamine-1-phosphotransferase subunits alpha/beta-like [Clavelina lepadiformis]|uniref:N-acetylglucosamine-1-phosphotransferase subunits alpha/beta-like n=1 Tax=Clavelina lepadiformis TaxID=159417 RepID=UPI0040437463
MVGVAFQCKYYPSKWLVKNFQVASSGETKKDPDPIEAYTESLHHVAHIFQSVFKQRNLNFLQIVSGESSSVHVSLSNDDKQNGKAFETIQRKPPKFICINDNLDYRSRDTQQVLTSLRYFYEKMYPDPSPFEVRQ